MLSNSEKIKNNQLIYAQSNSTKDSLRDSELFLP